MVDQEPEVLSSRPLHGREALDGGCCVEARLGVARGVAQGSCRTAMGLPRGQERAGERPRTCHRRGADGRLDRRAPVGRRGEGGEPADAAWDAVHIARRVTDRPHLPAGCSPVLVDRPVDPVRARGWGGDDDAPVDDGAVVHLGEPDELTMVISCRHHIARRIPERSVLVAGGNPPVTDAAGDRARTDHRVPVDGGDRELAVVVLDQLVPQAGAVGGDGVVLLRDAEDARPAAALDVLPEGAVEVVDPEGRDLKEPAVGQLEPRAVLDRALAGDLWAEEPTWPTEVVVAKDQWRRAVARKAWCGVGDGVVVGR